MRQAGHEPGEAGSDPPDFEAFLQRLADIAAAATLPHFRTALDVVDKAGDRFDPVTVADRETERLIRAEIEKVFPDHGIIGEELGDLRTDADNVWVIDPIDGTRSFIAGVPLWGVLVGLLHRGKPRFGLMAQPFTGERFFGDGAVSHYSGPGGDRRLATRSCGSIEGAVLFTTAPDLFSPAEGEAYRRVEARARLARYGTDCYAYCMLASGLVDIVIEAGLKPFDIQPLVPIIKGAGGRVTDWQGNSVPATGQVLVTGDAGLHDKVLEILNE